MLFTLNQISIFTISKFIVLGRSRNRHDVAHLVAYQALRDRRVGSDFALTEIGFVFGYYRIGQRSRRWPCS